VATLAVAAFFVVTKVIIPNKHYNTAAALRDAGRAEDGSWICPTCGRVCEINFCPNDGTPRPQGQATSKNVKVGDIITLGSYEQDGNTANGKETIEWIVLAKDGNKATLISKYGLEAKQYNESYTDVTWETCTLRKWLNGEFYNTAFSAEEQAQIVTTKVTADKNPEYSINPGENTADKVWLLSITEANKYFSNDKARMCAPTAHAVKNGAYQSSDDSVNGIGACWWWLRSPGRDSDRAAHVNTYGHVSTGGRDVYLDLGCVRPVVVLQLS